jgi:hypothetical protein
MKKITASYLQKNYDAVMSNALARPVVITKFGKPRFIVMSYALIEDFPPHLRAHVTGEPIVILPEEISPEMAAFLTSAPLPDEPGEAEGNLHVEQPPNSRRDNIHTISVQRRKTIKTKPALLDH